jgi:hypothetical protein
MTSNSPTGASVTAIGKRKIRVIRIIDGQWSDERFDMTIPDFIAEMERCGNAFEKFHSTPAHNGALQGLPEFAGLHGPTGDYKELSYADWTASRRMSD